MGIVKPKTILNCIEKYNNNPNITKLIVSLQPDLNNFQATHRKGLDTVDKCNKLRDFIHAIIFYIGNLLYFIYF